jgi:hypothetical protein
MVAQAAKMRHGILVTAVYWQRVLNTGLSPATADNVHD